VRIGPVLPDNLLADIEDATLTVLAWDAQSRELVVGVWKDNPEESGEARFCGVSFVCLPPVVKVRELAAGGVELLPEALGSAAPAPGDSVVALHPTWGLPWFVVCESVAYSRHT
jgi:hypothetical protein